MLTQNNIQQLVHLAEAAAAIILGHYQKTKPVDVTLKADQSPLTIADQEANECITTGLLAMFPAIPVLSEEGRQPPYSERKFWDRFWLVDPLDGTKEFINRTNNFTVNIALMEAGRPVFGVVVAPYYHASYYGIRGVGAFKKTGETIAPITVRPFHTEKPKILLSRSHRGKEYDLIKSLFPDWEVDGLGSSLKFCLLAEGLADAYVRSRPTSEWDTAAGQCVLSCAGGDVLALDGKPLRYNKEDTENPGFVAFTLRGWDQTLLLRHLPALRALP